MNLLFLVNGPEKSYPADRAREFARRLPATWTIQTGYRPAAHRWKGIARFVRHAMRFRPRVLYVMDTAYTGVLAGCIVKRRLGCRLITDTGDVAYELARSSGNYSRAQLALIDWNERLAMKKSDAIVVRGSFHKPLLEKQGVKNVAVIPDGMDVEAVRSIDASGLRAELGFASDMLVLGMVGTMNWSERHRMCYGWDVIEALAHLADERRVKGLLVGDGHGRPRLEKRARELGVQDRVVFTGMVPSGNVPRYATAMDVCVSTQSNDVVGMVRTTTKLPLYLACGRYVIATEVGEAKRVLPGVGALLPYKGVRDPEHPVRLASHVRQLLANPALLNRRDAVQQVAAENFEYNDLAARVRALCEELAATKP